MIFKTLSIENIRSYKEVHIKFPIGTSLFEGDIGSGKSTILMAIEFALFGLGNQKGDSLLRKKTAKGTVSLEMEVDGKICKIKRSLVKNPDNGSIRQSKGYISFGQSRWQLSPSEMKEKVLEILNFREPNNPRAQSVIFRYAIYTPQEEMKVILSQKPDERLQTLRKAFGIEDYKIAAENANILSRSIKDKLIELKTETKDLDDKKQELFVLKGNLDANKTKNAKSQARGEELDILQKKQKETLEKLQESELELKKIQAEIPHLEKQIEEKEKLSIKYHNEIKTCEEENQQKITPQIEALEKIEQPTSETEENLSSKLVAIRKIIKEHDSLKSNLALLNDSKQSTENELGENKNKTSEELLKEKDALILKIKEKYDAFKLDKEQLQKITEKIYKLDVEKSEIIKKLDNVDGLGDLCPICGSILNEEHKKNLKTESDEKIRKINSESKILSQVELKGKKQLESEEIEIKTLENNNLNDLNLLMDKISRLDDLKNKINSIYMKLNSFDTDLKSIIDGSVEFDETDKYITYFETLLDKLKEYNRSQKDLENVKYQFKKNFDKIKENKENIEVLTAEINSLKQNLVMFHEKLEKLKNVPNEIAEVKFNYQKTEEEFQEVKAKIVETKTLVEKLQEDISKVKDEINKKESLKKQLDKFNDYHIWLNDYLIPTLSLIEKHVMQKRYEEFNGDFQKWFSILIEDISKTAKIDEEFTPIVEQDGFEQDINYLSGGEKTSVALAYRLALNNIVQKVSTGMKSNLLILDEPTDGFSREQLYKVREILNELDCPQVIIVSHERELGSFADNVFKVEKIDGNSCVTLSG